MAVDAYWSIDAPGLDADGAEALAEAARGFSGVVGVSVVDPSLWLTRHLDAQTVQLLVTALSAAIGGGHLSDAAAWEVTQMLDDHRQWLDAARDPGD